MESTIARPVCLLHAAASVLCVGLWLCCSRGGPGEPKNEKGELEKCPRKVACFVVIRAKTRRLPHTPLPPPSLLSLTANQFIDPKHCLTHAYPTPRQPHRPLLPGPGVATRGHKPASPSLPIPPPACLPSTQPTQTPQHNATMDTSSSTRPSWVNNTPHHAHAPLQSQQQLPPGGGAPVVMESLKLRVEEEREYYSVVAALPGVRKQGMRVDVCVRSLSCACARVGLRHGCCFLVALLPPVPHASSLPSSLHPQAPLSLLDTSRASGV